MSLFFFLFVSELPTWTVPVRWRWKRVVPVPAAVAAGTSGLVETNIFWNAFREMLNKSCFEFSDNSWILVLRSCVGTSTSGEKLLVAMG